MLTDDQPAGFIVAGAEQDQSVDDPLFGQISQRLVNPEHVLTERAAIAALLEALTIKQQFVPRSKQAQTLFGYLVEMMMCGT